MEIASPVAVRDVPAVHQLWDEFGPKALRYCGVSVFNVVTGQALLFLFHAVLGWSGVASNVAAVAIGTGPAYLLSRRWVWRQSGEHRLAAEVLPFWVMAFVGLGLSTLAVAWADHRFESSLAVNAAALGAFGVVWVLRFVVLDRLLWNDRPVAAA